MISAFILLRPQHSTTYASNHSKLSSKGLKKKMQKILFNKEFLKRFWDISLISYLWTQVWQNSKFLHCTQIRHSHPPKSLLTQSFKPTPMRILSTTTILFISLKHASFPNLPNMVTCSNKMLTFRKITIFSFISLSKYFSVSISLFMMKQAAVNMLTPSALCFRPILSRTKTFGSHYINTTHDISFI